MSVTHRWLSVLDVTLTTLKQLDAYILFYAAFLIKKPKPVALIINSVLSRLSLRQESIAALQDIQSKFGKRTLTKV